MTGPYSLVTIATYIHKALVDEERGSIVGNQVVSDGLRLWDPELSINHIGINNPRSIKDKRVLSFKVFPMWRGSITPKMISTLCTSSLATKSFTVGQAPLRERPLMEATLASLLAGGGFGDSS